jgi:hypothetical protein
VLLDIVDGYEVAIYKPEEGSFKLNISDIIQNLLNKLK